MAMCSHVKFDHILTVLIQFLESFCAYKCPGELHAQSEDQLHGEVSLHVSLQVGRLILLFWIKQPHAQYIQC